jgi:hypothetical protein
VLESLAVMKRAAQYCRDIAVRRWYTPKLSVHIRIRFQTTKNSIGPMKSGRPMRNAIR